MADAANIYLGPQERMYIANLQAFTKAVDPDVRIATMTVRPSATVNGSALRSTQVFAAYLHNRKDHSNLTSGVTVQVGIPHEGVAYWYSPETGMTSPGFNLSAGLQTLEDRHLSLTLL